MICCFRHLTGIFAQTWPYLKRSTGEVIEHKFTRNKSSRKYWLLKYWLLTLSCFNFHAFTASIPLTGMRTSLSPLIQVNLLKRSNIVFTSVIWNTFNLVSCYTINRVLFWVRNSTIKEMVPRYYYTCPTHQKQQAFYITLPREKDLGLLENYASELHQVMILHLSRAGMISWD